MAKTTFYTKADYAIRNKHPEEVVYELGEKYGVTKEDVTDYLNTKRTAKGVALALAPISTAEQKNLYNTLDERFIEEYPEVVSYRRGDNIYFHQYESGVYKEILDTDMRNLVDTFMHKLGLLEQRATRNKVKDTVERIGSLLSRTKGRHFNDDMKSEYLLNLKNGLLDMKTYKLKDHTPEYFSTAQVPYDYDPEAEAPKFVAFLDVISNGDDTTRTMIQDMFGYCIGEGNPNHKVFYLYGDIARNGKSTTAKLLCGLIGRDNYTALSLQQLSSDNSSTLTSLIGKQLNFSDEVSAKYIESSMLTTMSAEGIIEINPKYKAPFMQQIKTKFIVACNDLPKFQNGQGMKHRMISIPFDHFIPEKSRILRFDEVLLEEEGSGILNWAIAGAKELADRGEFLINEKSKQSMMENTKESNSVYSFLYDEYEYSSTDTTETRVKDMYATYKNYCMDDGLKAKSYNAFAKEVHRFGRETKLLEHKSTNRGSCVVGIGLDF